MSDWRPIPGVPEQYLASEDGRICIRRYTKSYVSADGTTYLKSNGGTVLVPRVSERSRGRSGFLNLYVNIYVGNDRNIERRVDGLIARAWLPLPFDQRDIRAQKKWIVYHIDGDPLNCRAANLEWVPNFGANDPVERRAKINAWREGNRFDASAAVARIFSEAA